MLKLHEIFKKYRGLGWNLTVQQALASHNPKTVKSVRAKILMACVENQATCFYQLWPETHDYPGAILIWREVAKQGYAPQALNRDPAALTLFHKLQEGQ